MCMISCALQDFVLMYCIHVHGCFAMPMHAHMRTHACDIHYHGTAVFVFLWPRLRHAHSLFG